MAAGSSTAFPRQAIGACLDRITGSEHFSRSLRLSRFLRFTMESLLDGRADELKERTIGVEVYGRPLEYDPRTDPIVRSEAHRLRTRLAAYYAREGSADPIVIDLPKGSYVPELHPNTTEPARGLEGCRLVVTPFDDRCSHGARGETPSRRRLRARPASIGSRHAPSSRSRRPCCWKPWAAPGARDAGAHETSPGAWPGSSRAWRPPCPEASGFSRSFSSPPSKQSSTRK